MNEQKTLKVDVEKFEIVVEILAKLHINGSIKEGQLQKKDLYKMTNDYTRIKKILDFTYRDMPGAMLKYGFCYYMEKEQAHKSKYFNVNTSAIEKLAVKYSNNDFLNESPEVSDEENYGDFDYSVKYVLTIELKENKNFVFSAKSCIVCMETFDDQRKFECHMKSHGKEFLVRKAYKWWPQMINLNTDFQLDKGKFVFRITPHEDEEDEITIDRIFLVLEDNDFHAMKMYSHGSCTQFDIHCDIFSTENHPYTILVLFTFSGTISLVAQYHFKLEKLLCSKDLVDDPIKVNESKLLKHIKKMVFKKLPSYYPSKEMKSLIRRKFAGNKCTKSEKSLLTVISEFLKHGVRQHTYVSFWKTLIEMEDCAAEEQYAKLDKSRQRLKFVEGFYLVPIPNLSELSPTIMEWTKVIVAPSDQPKKKVHGRVHQVRKNDVVLIIEDPLDLNSMYDIRFLTNRLTIQLEMEALNYVALHNISRFFFPTTVPRHHFDQFEFEWINENVKRNPEQQIAIANIVGKASFPAPYILMGPPGTGKTTTIVEAICQILQVKPDTHILVTASSNYACNVITHRLLNHLPDTSIYRMFAGSKEAEIDSIDPSLVKISNLKFGKHYYPTLEYLSGYSVVLTTLAVAGRFALAGISCMHFSYVFLDESGSSTEPSTLLPIAGVISSENTIHGQVILAGDPKQLGPIVLSDTAKKYLGVSLLERLIDTGIYARDPSTGKYNPRVMTKLIRNFRSHPKILEFPNEMFYNGELLAKGRPEGTNWACNWKYLPNKSIPMLFEDVIGESEQDDNSPSWYNKREVKRVIFYIQKIMRERKAFGREITQKDIGVITPYKKQCQKIVIECKRRNWVDIDVGSVEKFQGQEKPVIILSTVRSMTRSVGFLNNPKRLNVALTRAQALLIVVGNADTLQTDAMWNEFINFCKENSLMKQVEQENEAVQSKHQVGKARSGKKIKTPVMEVQPSKQNLECLPFLPDVPKDNTTRQSSASDNLKNDRHNVLPLYANMANKEDCSRDLRKVPSTERASTLFSGSSVGSSSHGNFTSTNLRASSPYGFGSSYVNNVGSRQISYASRPSNEYYSVPRIEMRTSNPIVRPQKPKNSTCVIM